MVAASKSFPLSTDLDDTAPPLGWMRVWVFERPGYVDFDPVDEDAMGTPILVPDDWRMASTAVGVVLMHPSGQAHDAWSTLRAARGPLWHTTAPKPPFRLEFPDL